MTRKTIIAGNWKMNQSISESVALAQGIVEQAQSLSNLEVDVVICPPYLALTEVKKVVAGTSVKLGAQDVHWESNGAYTGKISTEMLVDAGVEYVILGHSEQRTYFGETDEIVNKKLKKSLDSGLTPLVCVGETLEERDSGAMNTVLKNQLEGSYADLSEADALKTVIAYEPVWAIGTGKVATDDQAQEAHAYIRSVLKVLYSDSVSESIRIQYGGSMKPGNARGLLGQKDVDGGLIGGASLQAESFIGIINPQ
jgi:triosephosphate isomerase